MTHHNLPPTVESIRRAIKELIPETATSPNQPAENQAAIFHENTHGNKTYRGDLLAEKISLLTEQLRITEKLQIGAVCPLIIIHVAGNRLTRK